MSVFKTGPFKGKKILARIRVEAKSYTSAKSKAITKYLQQHPKTKRQNLTASVTKSPISGLYLCYIVRR